MIQALRTADERLRIIAVCSGLSPVTATDAIHAGAIEVLEKPFSAAAAIAAVRSVFAPNGARMFAPPFARVNGRAANGHQPLPRPPLDAPGSVVERWISFVLRTIDASRDPKTIASWAQVLGVSRSALSECCRLVHVSAHHARDFARLTRVICRSSEQWQPEVLLDFADTRTLRKLMVGAGLPLRPARTPAMPEFLERQQWIPQDNPGLIALRRLLFGAGG